MARRNLTVDPWLPGLTLILAAIGLVMIFSASAPRALAQFDDAWYFTSRQAMWTVLGLMALYVGTRTPPDIWRRATPLFLLVTVVLLVLTLIPGIGTEVNGARRWLRLGGMTIQPSELAKFTCVLYMAGYLGRKSGQVAQGSTGTTARPLFVLGLLLVLIGAAPDLGNGVAISAVAGGMLFAAGLGWVYIIGLGALGTLAIALAVWLEPYRMARLTSYLDPWQDPTGTGFQVVQSLLAFGSGGIGGLGLGEGQQKLFFLPEAHTDFIYAVVGEELGLVGAAGVLILFALFAWRGLNVARTRRDPYHGYLALGLTLMIVLQALINMGVTVGVLPNKGLPLPFMSYGGSSLFLNLFAAGVLIHLSRRCYAQPARRGTT